MKTLFKILAFTALLIGIRLYKCSSFRDDYKMSSLAECGEEQSCIDRVESEEWNNCFDFAYTIGRHSSFDEGRFMACMVNSRRH